MVASIAQDGSAPGAKAAVDQPQDQTGDPRIIRRVTLRVIPFLMLCYVIASLNRVNLSFAALQMNKDLGLSATAYGFGAGVFFITYCPVRNPLQSAFASVSAPAAGSPASC